MIRINLLGAAKPKRGKKPVIEATGGVSLMFAGTLIFLAVALVGNGYWYWKLQRDTSNLQEQLHKADVENRRLAEVKASYLEQEKVRDNYKRRVDVIDKLHQDQQGPVKLLNMIQQTVDSTDEVWLDLMTDTGANLQLKGSALNVDAVANLMRNLQDTGFFKAVELKETNQNEASKDIDVFKFTLDCQKPGGGGGGAPGPAAPPKPVVKS